jgi:uncharacterized oligopeptide transporter (OPT) family protein
LEATIAASVVGIVIAIVKEKVHANWTVLIPSVAGFGFALILPGELNIPIAAGGVGGWIWQKVSRNSYDRYAITVASGFIAGEALLGGLILPILSAIGVKLG